ncbi:MAG: ATP-binding protein [Cyanobacteria bacterium P01_A01_bin.40]
MKHSQPKFKLLQYFSLTSLIAFIVTITFLGLFYRYQSLTYLLTLGEENNVALTQSFSNSLWLKFDDFLTNTKSLSVAELRRHPQTALLEEAVHRQMQGLSVVKVKIYDLTGKAVFSTDKTQIGEDKSKFARFIAAKSGQVVTRLDHRHSFDAISGTVNNVHIISSYIPIYSQGATKEIEGVFELYSDVTALEERIEANQRTIILVTTLVFTLLYLVLFAIVKTASKTIHSQNRALLKSRAQYKKQAQQEAIAAERSQATAKIIDRVRRFQDLKTIFQETTRELRDVLQCDRLIIYQFNPDWSGQVVAESVGSGWISLIVEQKKHEVVGSSHLDTDRCLLGDWSQGDKGDIVEPDQFIKETQGGKYTLGQKFTAVDDIYSQDFPDCYLKSLEKYQAKAYLIVPIFQEKKLWGLLGAYQNNRKRVWQDQEIDLMMLIASQLAVALQHAEYVNQLKLQKRDLEITVQELKLAQQQVIQQEKLAALGQLVAGVAHEINTPLGAIQASASDNSKALIAAISELPKLSEYLNESEKDTFFKLLDLAILSKPFYSSRERRPLKRHLTNQLKEYQIDNPRRNADLLIDIGVHGEIDLYLSLLKHPQVNWILDLTYNIACLMSNNHTVITSVEKAAKVVFALKNYARFDHSGQKKLTDITTGLETVLEIYHNQLKHKIEVLRHYHELPNIWCYPDELIQVWTNIIHNGIQAMSEGGTLTIEAFAANNGIKVEISDSGSGIPPDIQERMFEPFFTTKSSGQGSGLGLHISRKIVDKHQGKIAVVSEPGHTRFSVWLPDGQ